jgi:hypothetical protein
MFGQSERVTSFVKQPFTVDVVEGVETIGIKTTAVAVAIVQTGAWVRHFIVYVGNASPL